MTMTMPARELDRLSRSGLSAADLENLDDDLAGRTVYVRGGDQIGTVEDELVEPRQLRVPFLILTWGGVLGIGKQQRLVPMEAISRIETDGVHIDRDKELIVSAPAYHDNLEVEDAELHYSAVYDLYGITPYWMGQQPNS
jgi:sporulation protein YlmC with PRC-barrel domain